MTDTERQDGERREEDFEELAAFIDGRLSGERKARMEKRLLFDEDLYEVFLETVRFREQDGAGAAEVALHPRAFPAADGADRRPRFGRWWGPAAALAAAAVVAFLVVLPRGERSAADWASLLPPGDPAATYGEGWDDAPWSRTRSAGADCERYGEARCAFRLGAKVLKLEVALRAGDSEAAGRQASTIAAWASVLQLYFVAERYENLRDRLVAGAPADELRTVATIAERNLVESLASGPEAQRFAAGHWAETARLAALAGDRGLFARLLRQRPEVARTLEIEASLEQIEEILARGAVGEEGRRELDAAFRPIFETLGG